ncbi:MAG: hypothetical protein M0035_08070 [Actinomycetota bacterium]|jgi:hypothetical protein|nr:hypothetical protein [Actinomycetota bacterium]
MRVVFEARPKIGDVLVERIGGAATAFAGDAFPIQVRPDGLAVPAEVAGDGRDRPSPLA